MRRSPRGHVVLSHELHHGRDELIVAELFKSGLARPDVGDMYAGGGGGGHMNDESVWRIVVSAQFDADCFEVCSGYWQSIVITTVMLAS